MKYYLDEKEVTLEELEETRKNLVEIPYFVQVLKVWKIEPNAIYFIVDTFAE